MASTLQHQLALVGEMNADVRAVDLLFHDERLIGNELIRFDFAQMPVVVRPLRPKQVRSARILGEVAIGRAHQITPPASIDRWRAE